MNEVLKMLDARIAEYNKALKTERNEPLIQRRIEALAIRRAIRNMVRRK